MNAYLSLVDHGFPVTLQSSQSQPTNPQIALQHLINHGHEHKLLPCEIPWRLDQQTCRELELRSGIRPTGGWRELCSLAAGARFLRAVSNGFVPDTTVDDLLSYEPATIRTKLLESFTIHLAPPATAANLFLLMNIHPIWGLRLAYASNHCLPQIDNTMRFGERDQSIFPQPVLETLNQAVFGMIACIIATLRKLDPNQAYNLDALAGLINAIGNFCQRQTELQLKRNASHSLPVFLPDEIYPDGLHIQSHHRTSEFLTLGFVEQLFIPAGAMRRFDDGTFAINEAAFDALRIGKLDTEAQNQWLARFLADTSSRHQVA